MRARRKSRLFRLFPKLFLLVCIFSLSEAIYSIDRKSPQFNPSINATGTRRSKGMADIAMEAVGNYYGIPSTGVSEVSDYMSSTGGGGGGGGHGISLSGGEFPVLLSSALYGLKGGVVLGSLAGIVKLLILALPLFSLLTGMLFALKSLVLAAGPSLILPGIATALMNAGIIPTTVPPGGTTTTPSSIPIITTLPPLITSILPNIFNRYHGGYGGHPYDPYWQYYYKKKK